MQLICKHDPADPNHLICETRHSPFFKQLRRRWEEFYCAGPNCPPHKAYAHLAADILFILLIVALVGVNIVLFTYARKVNERTATFTERINEMATITREHPIVRDTKPESEPFPEDGHFFFSAQALYFSATGEQLGRGTWPLRAGETTKIKIVLNTDIDFSVFEDIEISARLAPDVQWTGFAPLGQGLSYEPASRVARWLVSKQGSAVFEVAVTPSVQAPDEDILPILQNVRMRGREIETGAAREIVVPDAAITFLQK